MENITEDDFFKQNPFKDRFSGRQYIACVGNNSGLNKFSRDCALIDGFKENVDLLFNNITSNEINNINIDVGIYPLLFCCRHSIELSLKLVLRNLISIYKIKNFIANDDGYISKINSICGSHDIGSLYKELVNFKDFQEELKEPFDEFKYFEDCVQDYFFDIQGDAFRYTFKRNWKDTHLEDIYHVDTGILYEKYKRLMQFFDYLINEFSRKLFMEYFKTHTKHLSRSKLEKLSVDLNGFDKWTKKEISEHRNELCKKYSISHNEFNNALNIISKHYSFSVNIGRENKFKDLNEEVFRKIGEIHKKIIIRNTNRKPRKSFSVFELVKEYKNDPLKDLCDDLVQNLTDIEKKVFLSLYEITSHPIDRDYLPEEIDDVFNGMKDDEINNKYMDEKIRYMIESGKLREALEKCGQITYLKWYDKYINDEN